MLYDFLFVILVRNIIETTNYDDAAQEVKSWISSILWAASRYFNELCDLSAKHELDRANDTDNSQLFDVKENDLTRTIQGDSLCNLILSNADNIVFQQHHLAKDLFDLANKRMYVISTPSKNKVHNLKVHLWGTSY